MSFGRMTCLLAKYLSVRLCFFAYAMGAGSSLALAYLANKCVFVVLKRSLGAKVWIRPLCIPRQCGGQHFSRFSISHDQV